MTTPKGTTPASSRRAGRGLGGRSHLRRSPRAHATMSSSASEQGRSGDNCDVDAARRAPPGWQPVDRCVGASSTAARRRDWSAVVAHHLIEEMTVERSRAPRRKNPKRRTRDRTMHRVHTRGRFVTGRAGWRRVVHAVEAFRYQAGRDPSHQRPTKREACQVAGWTSSCASPCGVLTMIALGRRSVAIDVAARPR